MNPTGGSNRLDAMDYLKVIVEVFRPIEAERPVPSTAC
jgi:hypothetical protein